MMQLHDVLVLQRLVVEAMEVFGELTLRSKALALMCNPSHCGIPSVPKSSPSR